MFATGRPVPALPRPGPGLDDQTGGLSSRGSRGSLDRLDRLDRLDSLDSLNSLNSLDRLDRPGYSGEYNTEYPQVNS